MHNAGLCGKWENLEYLDLHEKNVWCELMACLDFLFSWYVGYLLGHSVCCLVHGFEPYFYVSCPPGMNPDDISHFHKILEVICFISWLDHVCSVWIWLFWFTQLWFRGRWGRWIGTLKYPNLCDELNWCIKGASCIISSSNLIPFLRL